MGEHITPGGEFLHYGLTEKKITAFSAEHNKDLGSVEDQIRTLYQPFAEAVVQQIGDNRLLLVTGGRGIKKSSSFIPVLQNELVVNGVPAGAVSMESITLSSVQRIEQRYLPEDLSHGTLILDEANISHHDQDQKIQKY